MAKKIKLDKELCIGCGACEATAPDYFKMSDDGKAEVIKQYDDEGADVIGEAKDGCPVNAIEVSEE
jgi:ferredoxin